MRRTSGLLWIRQTQDLGTQASGPTPTEASLRPDAPGHHYNEDLAGLAPTGKVSTAASQRHLASLAPFVDDRSEAVRLSLGLGYGGFSRFGSTRPAAEAFNR